MLINQDIIFEQINNPFVVLYFQLRVHSKKSFLPQNLKNTKSH